MTATTSLSTFWDAWPLFQDAVMTSVFAGFTLGILGVYIVFGRMVFLSAALSQVASFGVTLAYAAQIFFSVSATLASPIVGAGILSILCLGLIWKNTGLERTQRDTMLGVMFLAGNAGTLLVASKITQELHDVKTLLFGSSVAVLPEETLMVLVVMCLTLFLHLWWWRGFVEVTYDEDTARVRGIPVQIVKLVLLVSIAVFISVSTRVLGALPTFAFSVFPALAAISVASNIPRALVLASIAGGICGFGGYLLAFLYEFPVGAAQAALGFLIWLSVAAISKISRLRGVA
jgi:zinc transport system permease protein